MKIVPKNWERFDNCQFFTEQFSDEEWGVFIENASRLGEIYK